MPTTHFNNWAEYFHHCYKEWNQKGSYEDRHPGHWKYFTMNNVFFMADRRKTGAEKAKFVRALQEAPTITEKVRIFLSDPHLREFAKRIAFEIYSDDSSIPMKDKRSALLNIEEGDKYLAERRFEQALESYNMAFTKVPQNEADILLRLYRKRFKALVSLEQINDALLDIDSIILHEKTSKETALKLLNGTITICNERGWFGLVESLDALIQMVQDGEEYRKVPRTKRNPLPQIDGFNGTYLEGSSDALELCIKEGKGRCLVAKRDIQLDEPLMMEKAFATRLFDDSREKYCFNCADDLNGRFEPCLGCDEVRFCSVYCRDECWKTVHSKECGYVGSMEFLTTSYNALRVVLIGGSEKALKNFRNPKPLEYWTKNKLTSNYEGFASLMAHSRRMADHQLLTFLFQSSIAAEFALLLQVFPAETDFLELTSLMFSHSLRIKTNGWAIYDSQHQQNGSAVFVSFSMPNHSCAPNSHQNYYGNTMVSNATKAIKKGEEVTMSYGPSVGSMELWQRQNKLRDQYDFECDCEGCRQDMMKLSQLDYDLPPPNLRRVTRSRQKLLQQNAFRQTSSRLEPYKQAVMRQHQLHHQRQVKSSERVMKRTQQVRVNPVSGMSTSLVGQRPNVNRPHQLGANDSIPIEVLQTKPDSPVQRSNN